MRTKVFRIFISSTFEDMKLERNILQNEVYEDLSKICEESGWQIEFVDLRWGINNEAKNQIMKICIDEINRCRDISPSHYFMLLIGDRYGWIPIPETIDEIHWGNLEKIAQELNAVELLKNHYTLDENNIPAHYVIKDQPGTDSEAYTMLRLVMDKYVEKLVSREIEYDHTKLEEIKLHFSGSATHQEIYHGLLDESLPSAQTIVYRRTIEAIDSFPESFGINEYNKEQLCELKDLIENKVDKNNLLDITVRDYNDYNSNDFKEYFRDKLTKIIKTIIQRDIDENANQDIFESDKFSQEQFLNERISIFCGRNTDLNNFSDVIQDEAPTIKYLEGISGCGKSALMAKSAQTNSENGQIVIFRSVGISPLSFNGRDLLASIMCELNEKLHCGFENPLLESFENLVDVLKPFIETYSKKTNVLIYIDAINQLPDGDPLINIELLKLANNPKIKFIVSRISNKTAISENIYRLEEFAVVKDSIVNDDILNACLEIVNRFLEHNNRKIAVAQEVSIKKLLIFKKSVSPIYLRLLSIVLCRVHHNDKIVYDTSNKYSVSYDESNICTFTIPVEDKELIIGLVSIYATPENHGDLVSKIFSLILNSERGVSVNEVLELLILDQNFFNDFRRRAHHKFESDVDKLPPILWSRLYFDIKHLLASKQVVGGRVLGFYHQLIKDSIKNSICIDDADKYIRIISEYFRNEWDKKKALRALEELPASLLRIKEFGILKGILSDFNFIQAKAANKQTFSLIKNFEQLPSEYKSGYLSELYKTIHRFSYQFNKYACESPLFTLQFLYNKYSTGNIRANIKHYIAQVNNKWLFIRKNSPKYTDNLALKREMHGATWCIRDVSLNETSKKIVAVDDHKCACVWDLDTGGLLNMFYLHNDEIIFCHIEDNGTVVFSASVDRILHKWEINEGRTLDTLVLDEDILAIDISDTANKIAVATQSALFIYDKEFENKEEVFYKHDKISSVKIISEQYIILGFSNGDIKCFDLYTTEKIKLAKGHNSAVTAIVANKDLSAVISISKDRLCRHSNNKIISTIDGNFTAISANNDNSRVITGDVNGILTLWVWDEGSNYYHLEKQFHGHSKDITSIKFLNDGVHAISVSRDRRCNYWNIEDESKLDNFQYTSCVYLSHTGENIFSASNQGIIKSWTKEIAHIISNEFPQDCFAIDVSPDGKYILVSAGDGDCQMWSTEQNKFIKLPQNPHDTFVNAVRFSHNGRYIATNAVGNNADCVTFALWDIQNLENIIIRSYTDKCLMADCEDYSFKTKIRLSEVENKFHVMHINGAYGVAFSPDDKHVAIALRDKTIAMFDIESREVIYKLGAGHYNEIKTVAFTPDGQYLVTGSWDNTLILWNLKTKQSERQFFGHDRGVYAADISNDGKLLLSGSRDHTCILWDMKTGQMLNRYVGDSACNSVRFTDEGFICGFDSGRVDVIKFGYGSNTICPNNGYNPTPIKADTFELPEGLINLSDELAKNVHDVWAEGRFSDGWHLGSQRNDLLKTHPSLIPYEELSEEEKDYDRRTSLQTIYFILSKGFEIKKK